MSLKAMGWAWKQETKSSGERLVLLALADHAGEDGECWPHSGKIAEKCGLDPKTVQRHITALHERGLVTKVHRRKRSNGTLAGWLYRLECNEGTPMSPLPEEEDVEEVSKRERVQGVLEGTSMYSQEPTLSNPQLEPTCDWDKWWELYPRKTNKQQAVKAWKRLSVKERKEAADGLHKHILYWSESKTEQRYIPHPATWLNSKRWEDQLPIVLPQIKEAPGMSKVRELLNEARQHG